MSVAKSLQDRIVKSRNAAAGIDFLRYVLDRFNRDNCRAAAAQLSYTVALALVPLAAIMLAMVAGTGWFDNLRADLILSIFEILGPGADTEFLRFFQDFVDAAGGMSGFGIIGLILTAILMLNTIQSAFARIWRVKKQRPLYVRLPIYWAVITLGPLLFAISIVASETVFATAEEAFDAQMIEEVGRWLPPANFWSSLFGLVLTIIMLSVCYIVLPNRRVAWRHALAGGATAGVLFFLLKNAFGLYIAYFPSYQAIYGALAAVPLFLVWLYLSWTIALIGAEIVASIPEWIVRQRNVGKHFTREDRARLAIGMLIKFSDASREGSPVRFSKLVPEQATPEITDAIIDSLRTSGFVDRNEDGFYVLIRDLEEARMHDLFKALNLTVSAGESNVENDEGRAWVEAVNGLLGKVEQDQKDVLGQSIRSFLLEFRQ